MLEVPIKNPGDELSSSEYTNCTSQEAQNAVIGSGQALSGITNTQLQQAIIRYQASGNQYVDSGAANSYVLTSRIASFAIGSYIDGLEVKFLATHTNTGAIDVNVNALGVKTVTFPDGSAVTTGTIAIGYYITFLYDLSSDEFKFVSSTSGVETDLIAYKAQLASQINPTGTTLLGYTGETVKTALDTRITLAALNATTGAAEVGKIGTGVNLGTGVTANVFFGKFVGAAKFNDGGTLVGGHNLSISKLTTGQYRATFSTPLPNADYAVLLTNVVLTSETNVLNVTAGTVTNTQFDMFNKTIFGAAINVSSAYVFVYRI